jgi:glycosyltransferase involved in cell wall biosynthesis
VTNETSTATVAVVIPSFNRMPVLPRAIDSVLAQSRPADEVILVDDGSTDETETLQHRYPEITYIKQENQGVSSARNTGIQEANSHWVAFLDSDDEWLPEKLEAQLQCAEEQPECPLVHSDEIWIRNGVRVNQMDKHAKAGGEIFERCLPLCAISPSAAMVQRDLLLDLGGFNEDLPACEDYDLWLRICAQHEVLFVDQPLLKKYGGHDDQLSRQYWGMDRFRVKALHDLLNSGVLDEYQESSARAMLLEKCEILEQGAEKRGNQQLLDELDALRAGYE